MKKTITLKQMASMGGKARAEKLTPERRKEIAINAVKARINKGKIELSTSSLQDTKE